MSDNWKTLAASVLIVMITSVFTVAEAQVPEDYGHIMERGAGTGVEPLRLENLVARAQDRQIPPEDLEGMLNPVFSLAENDLPHNAVIQKVLEGMAKRVPAENIRRVTEQMAGGLVRSAEIVDPWMVRTEVHSVIEAGRAQRDVNVVAREIRNMILENTSYALQQNMNEDNIRHFLDQVVTERAVERAGIAAVASAVRALPDLPTTQDDPELSNRILIRAMNAGFSTSEIQQLPDAFRTAQFHSQLPVENIARGLDQQMGRGMPAEHILENLFQGNVGGGPPGFTPPGLEGRDEEGDGPGRGRGRGRPPETPPGQNGPPGRN